MKTILTHLAVILVITCCVPNVSDASMVFIDGSVTQTFDSGGAGTVSVFDDPIPASFSPWQINSTINSGAGSAWAKSSARQIVEPSFYAIQLAAGTGVYQNDVSGTDFDSAASLTIDFNAARFEAVGGFGPIDGFVIFPNVSYYVGNSPGAFVSFELINIQFTGDVVRPNFNFATTINTAGASGSFSIFDVFPMTPASLADGQQSIVSGTVRMSARGGSESGIWLAGGGGSSPDAVPEPNSLLLLGMTGAGLIVFVRRRRDDRQRATH